MKPGLVHLRADAVDAHRRRWITLAAGLVAASVAVGCGGSDDPPSVTLGATPLSGAVGATITLSADAEDENDDVVEVRFYRVSSNAEELLATFTAAPYLFQTTIPTGASGSVSYKAVATDSEDNDGESEVIDIEVTS